VLARQQLADLWQAQHADHEFAGNIAIEQSIPVLAEHRRIPHWIVHREADEPPEQQIVVELLHQLPFRSHRIEGLQQQRAQQALWRNRRTAIAGIKLGKSARHLHKRRIDNLADRPQRMICRNAILQSQIAEKIVRTIIRPAHRVSQPQGLSQMHRITLQTIRESTFSAAC
jgi:hypothetical protein